MVIRHFIDLYLLSDKTSLHLCYARIHIPTYTSVFTVWTIWNAQSPFFLNPNIDVTIKWMPPQPCLRMFVPKWGPSKISPLFSEYPPSYGVRMNLVLTKAEAGLHPQAHTNTPTHTQSSPQIWRLGPVIKALDLLYCVDKHPAFQTPRNTFIQRNNTIWRIRTRPIWANLPKPLLWLIRIEEGCRNQCDQSTLLRWLWKPCSGRPERSAALRSI